MRTRTIWAVIAAALLWGCGGGDRARVEDEQLLRSLTAARSAYLQGQPELATGLYREALQRARERDDQTAIAEISHDLGAAELQKGDAGAALATADAALEEMDRRGARETGPLRLLKAAALYRLGRSAEAAAAARAVASDDRSGPVIRARAVFVEGLIAGEAGDLRTVDQALSRLPAPDPRQPELAADRIELTGWRAFLVGDFGQARRAFLEAADGRRLALDYRGMGRALAAAGDAATRDSDFAAAADLYLRAGRSAMIRGEAVQARLWLARAGTLADRARNPDLLAQSRALIREIAE
jgi:tetratricopeptide (TPR) repeat protein